MSDDVKQFFEYQEYLRRRLCDIYGIPPSFLTTSLKLIRRNNRGESAIWTPTAIELWNSKSFLVKRMQEQSIYLDNLSLNQVMSENRKSELREIAKIIGAKLVDRYCILNNNSLTRVVLLYRDIFKN